MNVVITSGFPFGGEPFLETESKYMPKDTVFFALSTTKEFNNTEYVAYKVPNKKINFMSILYAFCGLFSPFCVKEIIDMKRRKKLTIANLLTMYAVYGYGTRCYKFISKRLRKQCNKEILFYSYWMSTHAFIAAKLKKKFKRSFFITRCHGYDIYEYRNSNSYLAFRGLIFQYADKIMPISENGRRYLINTYDSYYSCLANKIEVSYLGTLNKGINPLKKSEIMQIVSCSNLVDVKRVHLIIEALSLLDSINIEWIHFGDGDCAKELKKLACEKLKKKNIQYFFKGHVENENVLQYYSSKHVDVFINVSAAEGIPVSIMEAMSFGIPVIATDVGGTGEIVESNNNGFLINADFEVNELKEKIEYLFNMTEDKKLKLRANARTTWATKFNAEKNYVSFYDNLVLQRMY